MKMASVRETGFPDSVDDNFLSCLICSEYYKNAKVLPCLHTFCESCIEKLAEKNGEVTCPICRRSHALPESGVAGVEENAFINDMVDLFRKREGDFAKSNKCGGCDQADSVKHCVECVVDICINCAQAHSRFRPTKSHRLLTIEEYETAKTDNPASVQPPVYCKNHRDNQLELFCDTCGVAICHDCTTLDHPRPEHKCRYLTDAAVAFRGALPKMIADGQSKEEKVVPRKAAATATLDSLDSCYLKAEKSLKEHTQSTIENATRVIQENGDTLLRELKELYDGKRRKLDSQIKELEIVQSGLQHAREFSEHLMRYGNASQLMASRGGIVTQFQKLLKIETEAKPADTGFLHFARHDNVFTIRALGMFRTVIAADDFTLEGPNTARVNGWVNWTLTHFLKLSNQILVEQVKSVLKRPDNSQEDMVSMNNGDGTWSFKTYIDVISNYEIAVSVSGKPVQGSPVTVKVIPQKGYIEELCSESIKNSGLMVTNGGNIRVFVTSGGQVSLTEFKPKHPSQYVHGTGVKVSDVSITCASSTKPEHPSLYVSSNNVNIGHNFGENPHTMFSALLTNGKLRTFTVVSTLYHGTCVLLHAENNMLTRTLYPSALQSNCVTSGIAVSPLDGKVYVACQSKRPTQSGYPYSCSYMREYQSSKPEALDDADCVHIFKNVNEYNYDIETQNTISLGKGGDRFRPGGIAISTEGKIYVSDEMNHCVQVFDSEDQFEFSFGSKGSGDDGMKQPKGLALDSDGNVYVCDYGNNRVMKYESGGKFICCIEKSHGDRPTAVCVTSDNPFGNVIVAYENGKVKLIAQ